ncbi:hypothetical protein PsorP6_017590 [Peronosclerospora sorghi]|uniref:Uncharacterized protein n=1 Tax=Peronosclerospora sorghi TaxID=230839 RepID=A0ACC0WL57_9STRA|nr:hypothetical protein PsorP6_017590 [Peronosclerospora sorghi]
MHSKGFVRGYKLVETRQIPYMSATGRPLFDVQDVSMNASMLEMLCYRFAARDSRISTLVESGTPQQRKQLQKRQRDLLRTCMSLLGEIAQKGGAAHSSICSSVSEQLADMYLRECHQRRRHQQTPTDMQLSAKKYLLASIKLFKVCIPSDSSSALTCSDDVATNIAPMDADEDGEIGSVMEEELN